MVEIILVFHKLPSCDLKLNAIVIVQRSRMEEYVRDDLLKKEHKKIPEGTCKMTNQKYMRNDFLY